ncbi:MAG: hypothetical protein CM15mP46_0460 [Alphaproteobacteria bacterium]|nr:MAG: hypothetical protein CM15mP46_0460 [Alphaproteobacteria bacterium]
MISKPFQKNQRRLSQSMMKMGEAAYSAEVIRLMQTRRLAK